MLKKNYVLKKKAVISLYADEMSLHTNIIISFISKMFPVPDYIIQYHKAGLIKSNLKSFFSQPLEVRVL